MKHYLTIALLCVASMAFGQDIIKMIDGRVIEASVKEIGDNSIVYKLWDSTDGPDYRVDKSMVGSIKLRSGEEYIYSNIIKAANAGISVPTALKNKPYSILDATTGKKLSKEELKLILSNDQFESYLTSQKMKKAAIPLAIAGAGVAAAGAILGIVASNNDNVDMAGAADAAIGAGVVGIIVALPFSIIAQNKVRNIVEDYNKQRGMLSLASTQNGFGLIYTF